MKNMLLIVLFSLPLLTYAQTCQTNSIRATTPINRFTINSDGTVTDMQTKLMWKRCSEGRMWDDATSSCNGDAKYYLWKNALSQNQISNMSNGFAGYKDWRLPNISELQSIIELQCFNPAINLTVFPATASSMFWSSSPYAYDNNNAWSVDFNLGRTTAYWENKNEYQQIRLVRSTQ